MHFFREVSWVSMETHGWSWKLSQISSHQNTEYEIHQPKPKHEMQFQFKITVVKHQLSHFLLHSLVDWVSYWWNHWESLLSQCARGICTADLPNHSHWELIKLFLQSNDIVIGGLALQLIPHVIFITFLYIYHNIGWSLSV